MECISSFIRISALESEKIYWADKLRTSFGMDSEMMPGIKDGSLLLRQSFKYLSKIPESMVRACKVVKLIFRDDMGPNKEFYPNHGFFNPMDNTVSLNVNIFYHPDIPEDFFDSNRKFITRPEQTLIHEMGHALDFNTGRPSMQDSWLKLSGWSKEKMPGLKRIIIREPNTPVVIGSWWYDPKAEFPRFYSKKNPEDDFADCYSYYVTGLTNKLPLCKKKYFDDTMGVYYKR